MVIVRLVDMPCNVGGVTVEDENGDHNVYINERWGYNGQLVTKAHERRHIEKGDIGSGEAIEVVEQALR